MPSQRLLYQKFTVITKHIMHIATYKLTSYYQSYFLEQLSLKALHFGYYCVITKTQTWIL